MFLIIAFIIAIWSFMTTSSFLTSANQVDINANLMSRYIEKIDRFSLQGFNKKHQLAYLIEAKEYLNSRQDSILLLDPKITFYKVEKKLYTMTSKQADYSNKSKIKFKTNVTLNSESDNYNINTEELLIDTEANYLIGKKQIMYSDDKAQIIAQGVHIKTKEDAIQLIGKISIKQNSGQTILTRDLFIDQSNDQKHYQSKNNTKYLAFDGQISAQGININTHKGTAILLGEVKIKQKSGVKINTKNLIINQKNNNDFYQTNEKVRYQSKALSIYASGLYYNAKDQVIKLTDGVVGHYEQID